MSIAALHNTTIRGSGPRDMVFAHGFGCDQNMWRLVAPAFEADFRTILFDHIGAGAFCPGVETAEQPVQFEVREAAGVRHAVLRRIALYIL